MAGVAPLLESILEVEYALKSGKSARWALRSFAGRSHSDWGRFLYTWLPQYEQGSNSDKLENCLKSSYQKAFLTLMKASLRGQSIANELSHLKAEVEDACHLEVETFLRLLPFKLLIPLLFLLFPAFMILLLGPILAQIGAL